MGIARGPYKKGIQRRQEILEAAGGVFGQFGYVAGSLQQIADQVGVSRAALARYFPDKEALLTALLNHWEEANLERAGGVSGLEYFRSLHHLISHNQEHRGSVELFLTLATEASNPSHPAHEFMAVRYRRNKSLMLEELRTAVVDGEILPLSEEEMRHEIEGLFALMDGLQIQWLLTPGADLPSMFDHHLTRIISRWQGGERECHLAIGATSRPEPDPLSSR